MMVSRVRDKHEKEGLAPIPENQRDVRTLRPARRLAILAALALAACGGSSSTTSSEQARSSSTAATAVQSPSTTTAASSPPATATPTTRTTTSASTEAQSASANAAGSPCRAAGLKLSYLGGQGATGHGLLGFAMRNTRTHECNTIGYPGIQFLCKSGAPLPTHPIHTTEDFFGHTKLRKVVVAPGQRRRSGWASHTARPRRRAA